MKKMQSGELAMIIAGSNRQCLIDGVLTGGAMILGIVGGSLGEAAALLGGLFAANSNGCFEKK